MKPIARKTTCKDGTTLSIQASQYHYSIPRDDCGPYSAVEVGFILNAAGEQVTPPETWEQFADGDGDFPNKVYGYIPRELIEEFIAQHGGSLTPDALR